MIEIPDEWMVRYDLFLEDVRGKSYSAVASYLVDELPYEWRATYLAMTPFPTDIAIVTEGTINYQFDWHTEYIPDAPIDRAESIKKEARLIAAYGYASSGLAPRPASSSPEMLGFIGRTQQYFGGGFDKGHFVAHTYGGSVNINLFQQARHVNRGWSDEGTAYRQMEEYCQRNPGAMFFSRPFYDSPIGPPCAIEFGILGANCILCRHIFTNSPEYVRKIRKRKAGRKKRGESSCRDSIIMPERPAE